jgi:hypothetical protein
MTVSVLRSQVGKRLIKKCPLIEVAKVSNLLFHSTVPRNTHLKLHEQALHRNVRLHQVETAFLS